MKSYFIANKNRMAKCVCCCVFVKWTKLKENKEEWESKWPDKIS